MVQRVISGGDKLEASLKAIARGLRRGAGLKVGFLENARYPSGISVAQVAAYQNWGAPRAGIPARPFLY